MLCVNIHQDEAAERLYMRSDKIQKDLIRLISTYSEFVSTFLDGSSGECLLPALTHRDKERLICQFHQ
jgi:hypothetical protein